MESMALYLTKALTVFALPLGQALVGVLLSAVWVLWGRRRAGGVMLLASVAWLWAWSMPIVSNWVTGRLEAPYPPMAAERMPQAGAILVLGGAVQGPESRLLYPELGSAADRLWHAARLYHAGKAPLVIASGGNPPWLGQTVTEAAAMRSVLAALGVPASAVTLEEESRNTRENMLRSREVLERLGLRGVLLVTSAMHMRRALAAAADAGLEVIPAPADYLSRERPYGALDFLPDAPALADSSRALKEYLGCLLMPNCR